MDDVMFLRNGPMALIVYSELATEYYKHNRGESNQISLDNKDQQVGLHMVVFC